MSVHNANRRVGTPEDLRCFTRSPIVGSPNAPSPVLPQFQSPNLLRSSIVSPSEHTLRVPGSRFSFPEAQLAFSELITLLEGMGSLDGGSLKLDIHSRNAEIVYDTIEAMTCQTMERSETNISHYRILNSSLTRLLSGCIERAPEGMTCSGIWRPALIDFVTRLKPGSADSATENFPRSLRIDRITASCNVRGCAYRFEISFTAFGRQTVTTLLYLTTKDLGQIHNSRVRRSESCESTRSIDSFLSDPVVDWKELLYGYNGETTSKERKF